MADEPNAAGAGAYSSNLPGGKKTVSGASINSISLEIPGLAQVSRDLASVTSALNSLKTALQGMSSAFTAGPVVNMLSQISRSAQTTTQNLQGLTAAVGGASRGGGGGGGGGRVGGPPPSAPMGGGGGGASYYQSLASSAGGNNNSGGTSGAGASLGQTIGGAIGNATSSMVSAIPIVGGLAGGLLEFAGDMSMFPLRFMRERINKNRAAAYTMSGDLTPYQWQTGRTTAEMMSSLKNIPGYMQGDVNDVLNALTVGRNVGAGYGFGDDGGARSANFYGTIGNFQKITPGRGAGKVASIVGAQLGNVSSAQASAFYTGGAFSMVSAGGGMKSAGQWAEGIYNWLKNQRPGKLRGNDFNYGDLLGQNFPGSNINAWFDTVGVSPEMRDYWWSWALAKVKTGSSGDKVFSSMEENMKGNQAWRKATADTVLTRNEFGLAGQMTGQYATRERSNQWYNQMMGALVNRAVPGMTKGVLGMVQYMPDEVEQFLWNLMESSGPIGQILGGGIGIAAMGSAGDLGDLGDGGYGAMGGSGLAGLNPDVRAKVARMMKANPRLQVNSGLRDGYTSAKLKKKGIGNFGSGTPFIGDVGDGGTNRHSPHSAGWAVDIGPRSQYGWLQRNAHKFGLETAAGHGEPWHVQNAGTLSGFGSPMGKRGRIGDPGDIGLPFDIPNPLDAVGGLIGGIPGVGGLIDMVKGIYEVVKMIGSVISTAFGAMDRIGGMMTGGGLLDMAGAGPDKVQGKVSQYLSLMGLGASSGGSANTTIGYDDKFGAALPTSVTFNGESWKGAGATGAWRNAGGGGDSVGGSDAVSRILQKYSGAGQTVDAKVPDGATVGKMLSVMQAAKAAGLSGDELVAAVSIAGRESGFNPRAYNGNAATGDKSYGLWQINMIGSLGESRRKALGISSNDDLFTPEVNARAMKMLFDGRSTPFYDWGPYKGQPALSGGAEDWVPAVYSVAKSQGYIGDPGIDYQAAGGGVRNTSMQFNNTFHISGGGGSGLDIGRVVPIVADRLEEEMRKRLAVVR